MRHKEYGEGKRWKYAVILNGLLLVFEIFATLWMMSGIRISKGSAPLMASRIGMLRYFTVDSNILMGIAAGFLFFYQLQMIRGKRDSLPKRGYALKLAATTGVTLTMLVTVFFLAPTSKFGWLSLFSDSNFFLHLLNPLLAILIFVGFEKKKEKCMPVTVWGIVPMLLYAVYYLGVALSNVENGSITGGADWYGFFLFGVKSIWIVLPLLFFITYLISFALWFGNQKLRK